MVHSLSLNLAFFVYAIHHLHSHTNFSSSYSIVVNNDFVLFCVHTSGIPVAGLLCVLLSSPTHSHLHHVVTNLC